MINAINSYKLYSIEFLEARNSNVVSWYWYEYEYEQE